jgi:hypothetical protein
MRGQTAAKTNYPKLALGEGTCTLPGVPSQLELS